MSSFVVYSVIFDGAETLLRSVHHTCQSTLFYDMRLGTVNGTPYVLSLFRTLDSFRPKSCSIFKIDWKEEEGSVTPFCTYTVAPTSNRLFLRRYSGSEHVIITHEKGFTFASFPNSTMATIAFNVSSLPITCLSFNTSLLFLLDTGGFITYTGGILRTISIASSEDSLLFGRSGASGVIQHLLLVDNWLLMVTNSSQVATIPQTALTSQATVPFQNLSFAPCAQLLPLGSDDELAFLLRRGGVAGCAELLPYASSVELQPLPFEGTIDACQLMEWKQTAIVCIQSKGEITCFELDGQALKSLTLPNLITEGDLLAIDALGDVLIQVTRNCLRWSCDDCVTSETLEDGHVFTAASIVHGNVWLLVDSSELRRWSVRSSWMKTESLFVSNERVRFMEPLDDEVVALATATELLVIDDSHVTRRTLHAPPVSLSHVQSLRHWLILLADACCFHFFHYASESLSLLHSTVTDSPVHFSHVADGSLLLSVDEASARLKNAKETAMAASSSLSARSNSFSSISPLDGKETSTVGPGHANPSHVNQCHINPGHINQTNTFQSHVNQTNTFQNHVNQTNVNQTRFNNLLLRSQPLQLIPFSCQQTSLHFRFREKAAIAFSSSSLFRVLEKPSLFAPKNAQLAQSRSIFPLSANQAVILPESAKTAPSLATPHSLQPWTPLRSLSVAVSLGTKLLFASQKSLFLTSFAQPVEENALVLEEPCRALRRLSDRFVVAIAQSSLYVVEVDDGLRVVASVDVSIGFFCHVAERRNRARCDRSGWSYRRRYERRSGSLLPV